jgi:hypothetical protein
VLEKLESPLTLPFKVQVPRGASQPLQLSAMLLHERLIGFDMKASCLVGGGGGGTATPGSRSLSSRRAGDEAEQHGACAAAMASPGAGGSRAHDDDEEAGGVSPDQWNAAAEAARLVQQKQSRANKRRHVAALAPTPNADAGDEVDAAPDDRAPQHKRSHTTLRWMQQPVAQQLSAPVGQVAPAPLQQQRGGFGAGIAARYQQAFHAQPHPAKEPAPVAAAAAVAADAGQAAAAVDAAGVQVTPSPSSTTQQQSPAAASTAAVGAALCAAASSNLCADDMLQQLPAGMGSLFDLLAEADEAGEDAPDSKQQHPHVHGTAQRTSPAPAAMLLPRAPAPWLAMPGEQRQQPQEPEHQRSSSSSAVLRGSRLINQQQQQQPRRQQQSQSQSASCIFGAAVMKSHKVGMLRPQAGHVPGSAALPPGAMVPTTELGGSARAAGSAAVSLAAAAQPLCEQELCTPPRQIVKPAFADMSTSAPMPTGGGGSYSSSASRQSAASRWQLPQPGAGSAAKAGQRACHVLQQAPSQSAQQQRPLPDLGRFAFTGEGLDSPRAAHSRTLPRCGSLLNAAALPCTCFCLRMQRPVDSLAAHRQLLPSGPRRTRCCLGTKAPHRAPQPHPSSRHTRSTAPAQAARVHTAQRCSSSCQLQPCHGMSTWRPAQRRVLLAAHSQPQCAQHGRRLKGNSRAGSSRRHCWHQRPRVRRRRLSPAAG